MFDTYEGEYSRITQEVKDLCYGLYGKTTLPINPELRKKALKDYPRGEQHITVRPGSILEPEMAGVKETFKDLAKDIDDEVLLALYPVTGKKFLKIKYGIDEMPADMKARTMEDVKKDDELVRKALAGELSASGASASDGNMQEMEVFVDGEKFNVSIPNAKGSSRPMRKKKDPKENTVDDSGAVKSPIPGMIVEYKFKNGDAVKEGDVVVVLEAMKMMNSFQANKDGVLAGIKFDSGDSVAKNDVLFVIE